MTERKHIGVETDKSLAEAFEHRCKVAGVSKSEALRKFMEQFSTGGSARDEIERKLEEEREELQEIETEKAELESEISSKKSKIDMLETKLDEFEAQDEEYNRLVESLAEVHKNGGDIRGTPNFEEAVDISEKSVEEVVKDVESRAETIEDTVEGPDVDVRDEYDL